MFPSTPVIPITKTGFLFFDRLGVMDNIDLTYHVFKNLAYNLCGTADKRVFRAHFGICLEAVVMIWSYLTIPSVEPKHLLWSLYFLKVYPLVDVATTWAKTSKKTWINWIWLVLQNLYENMCLVWLIIFI